LERCPSLQHPKGFGKMNERIEKLADECWSKSEYDPSIDPWFNHRKFAELIVRDCLSIVENNNPRPPGTTIMYSLDKDEYFDTGWQVAVETKSRHIKQHFGVNDEQ
jgi:hypothetical protein